MSKHIVAITFDERAIDLSKFNQHDRERVVTDLLELNHFVLKGVASPYQLHIGAAENKLHVNVSGQNDQKVVVALSLYPLRRTLKDYKIVCESYLSALQDADPSKVEAIDMGRRGLHDEGADLVIELTQEVVEMDHETARRFFSLIYVLHLR